MAERDLVRDEIQLGGLRAREADCKRFGKSGPPEELRLDRRFSVQSIAVVKFTAAEHG